MYKADIIREVATRTGYRQSDVREVWDTALDCIEHALLEGRPIHMTPVGHLEVVTYPARKRFLPQIGEIECPPSRLVKFKMAQPLTEKMRQRDEEKFSLAERDESGGDE